MANRNGLDRVLGWLWQRGASHEIDAADVGTAFGMELSLYPDEAGTDTADADFKGKHDAKAHAPTPR